MHGILFAGLRTSGTLQPEKSHHKKETMAVMEKDMTKGSPFRLILAFTVPLIIGNVFQQLYNMVDAIIVGRTVGVNALAAVGMSGSVVFLILG